MQYKKNNNNYTICIEKGEKLLEILRDFAAKEGIKNGFFVGIGGASKAEIGFFDAKLKKYNIKKYEEPLEIVNITGNIAVMDEKQILHAHITLGREDYGVIAGHLIEAVVFPVCEISLIKFDGEAERYLDEKTGLKSLRM